MAFWKAFPKTFTWRWTCFLQPSQWTPGCQRCKFTVVRVLGILTKDKTFLFPPLPSPSRFRNSKHSQCDGILLWLQTWGRVDENNPEVGYVLFYLTASLISFWSPWCQVPRPSIGIWLPVNSSRLLCGIDWYWILLHGILYGIAWHLMERIGIAWYCMASRS